MNDLSAFENEWMEIELLGCSALWFDEPQLPNVPNFLKEVPTPQSWTDCCKNSKLFLTMLVTLMLGGPLFEDPLNLNYNV